MKRQKYTRSLSFFTCLLLLLLAGCTLGNNSSPTPSATGEGTPPEISPTSTVYSSPMIRVTPTMTPTSTPTIKPSVTPLPTLANDLAYETIVDLLKPQDQCELPCWFGITPGESDYFDVYNHFSQFSGIGYIGLSIKHLSVSEWFSLMVRFPAHFVDTQVFRSSGKKAGYLVAKAHISLIQDEKWVYGDPTYVEQWNEFFLPSIFTKFGPPGKIYLDTTRVSGDPSNVFPFVIWIIYPEQGFLIRYEGDNTKIGDNIRVCPLQIVFDIISWRTDLYSYEEFIKGDMAMGTSLGPQPLEDVTDFDIQSFYEKFKDAQYETCFDTPASLWP